MKNHVTDVPSLPRFASQQRSIISLDLLLISNKSYKQTNSIPQGQDGRGNNGANVNIHKCSASHFLFSLQFKEKWSALTYT